MKKLLLVLGACALSLASCSSGGSSNTPVSSNPYQLQGYKLNQDVSTQNCSVPNDQASVISCSGKQIAGVYTVTFNTPAGLPSAYLQLPTDSQYGVSIQQSPGGSCPQAAPATDGANYSCNFSITSNGTAEPGKTIYLMVNGALGAANLIAIQLQ